MITFHCVWFTCSVVVVVVFFWIDFKVPLSVSPLEDGADLYSDRPYRIQGTHRLIGKAVVVPIERHHRTRVYVSVTARATVYRLLSDVNSNKEFTVWRNDSEPVYAPGSDYVGNKNNLTRAVAHDFEAGTWKLAPGGPTFASPIIVESGGEVTAHTTRFFNKIIPPLRQNKRKLLAALLFIAVSNACSILFR